jgi:hypothetical protein
LLIACPNAIVLLHGQAMRGRLRCGKDDGSPGRYELKKFEYGSSLRHQACSRATFPGDPERGVK